MKMDYSPRVEALAEAPLSYELTELQEFERGTAEAAAVRAALGEPVVAAPLEGAPLPLVIVGYDARRIADLLAGQRSELKTSVRPIAVVGLADAGEPDPLIQQLADLVLPPHPAREDLLEVGQTLATVHRRLCEMPLNTDDRALALLQLGYSRNQPLDPLIDGDAPMAYDYPLADLLLHTSAEETMELLEDMRRHGIFDATPVDRVFVCPDCHGYRVPVKELCPECHSPNLSLESSMHHFRCGYVAPESEFMVQGRPICPKCHTPLRHIGVEYNRPGMFSVCHDCNHWASEPELRAWCVACNSYHHPNELVPVHIKRYALSRRGVEIARAGSWNLARTRVLGDSSADREACADARDAHQKELTRLLVNLATDRRHPMAVYRVALSSREAPNSRLVGDVEKFLGRMARNQEFVTQLDDTTFLIVLPRSGKKVPDANGIRHDVGVKFHTQVEVTRLQGSEADPLRASA
ncbi:MAG TPA: hypothetical protein VFQ88_13285 [Nevskiaceae bacterium]|nr:hypothetical protein [Nevskiaceae bacterium]